MVEQKLNYIHHNPVKGKWSLLEAFILYSNSSAVFYEIGEVNRKVEIVLYKDVNIESKVNNDITTDEASESSDE